MTCNNTYRKASTSESRLRLFCLIYRGKQEWPVLRTRPAVLHLEDSHVLGLFLAVEVVPLDANFNAVHVALAARDVKGVAVEDIFHRFLGANLDILLALQIRQPLQPGGGHRRLILMQN